MIEMIKEAIRDGKVIGMAHHRPGHGPTVRMLEVYALGYTSRNNLAIRAKQIAGSGITLFPIKIGLFRIDRLSGPFFTGQLFTVNKPQNSDKGLHNIQAYAVPPGYKRVESKVMKKKFNPKGSKLQKLLRIGGKR